LLSADVIESLEKWLDIDEEVSTGKVIWPETLEKHNS